MSLSDDKEQRYVARLRILHEVDRGLLRHNTPLEIAEAALRPLRDLLGVPRAIVNLFDLEKGEVEWLAAIGRKELRAGGVRYPIALMGDLEALRRGEPQVIDTGALPPSPHRDALLASGVRIYMAVPMVAGEELIGALSFGGESAEFPPEQVEIAREVAAQLAIAIAQARLLEQVQRHAGEMERRVRERTAELELANKELESYSYTVSHDLRAPLRAIDGFARIFEEAYGPQVDDEGRRLLKVIRDASQRMGRLIESLLAFSRIGREVNAEPLDMGALAAEAWAELGGAPAFSMAELPEARGDRALLRQVWTNLLSNAVKYSAKSAEPRIEVSGERRDGERVYCVLDNGIGFDMRYYARLFNVFQRLHAEAEYPGTGVGLATVQRIVSRHGGRAWAESAPGAGARFFFSLPD
jgi:light-regulated signal transduction histidine kinase (bacteriophytochrome)